MRAVFPANSSWKREGPRCRGGERGRGGRGIAHRDADNDIPHAVQSVTLGSELAAELVESSHLFPHLALLLLSPSLNGSAPLSCLGSYLFLGLEVQPLRRYLLPARGENPLRSTIPRNFPFSPSPQALPSLRLPCQPCTARRLQGDIPSPSLDTEISRKGGLLLRKLFGPGRPGR